MIYECKMFSNYVKQVICDLYRAEELAAPYYIFKEAGLQVDIASIKGGAIPLGIIFYFSALSSRFLIAISFLISQLQDSSFCIAGLKIRALLPSLVAPLHNFASD
jgi:putative intracellular protease/amidase